MRVTAADNHCLCQEMRVQTHAAPYTSITGTKKKAGAAPHSCSCGEATQHIIDRTLMRIRNDIH